MHFIIAKSILKYCKVRKENLLDVQLESLARVCHRLRHSGVAIHLRVTAAMITPIYTSPSIHSSEINNDNYNY